MLKGGKYIAVHVSDSSERLRGAGPHAGVGIAGERGDEQRRDIPGSLRMLAADALEGFRRAPAHHEVLVPCERLGKRRHHLAGDRTQPAEDPGGAAAHGIRPDEHTYEPQSLMRT